MLRAKNTSALFLTVLFAATMLAVLLASMPEVHAVPIQNTNEATRHGIGGVDNIDGMRFQLVAATAINFSQEVKNAGFDPPITRCRRWYEVHHCDTANATVPICIGKNVAQADIDDCDTLDIESKNMIFGGESRSFLINTTGPKGECSINYTDTNIVLASPGAIKVCLNWAG